MKGIPLLVIKENRKLRQIILILIFGVLFVSRGSALENDFTPVPFIPNGNSIESDSLFFDFYLLEITFYSFLTLLHGLDNSWIKMGNPREYPDRQDETEYQDEKPEEYIPPIIEKRNLGDSDLPYFRTDFFTQFTNSDYGNIHGTIEGGYGPIALKYRISRFWKKNNPEDFLQFHSFPFGFFRMSYGNSVSLDFGVGMVIQQENDSDNKMGISLCIPLHIQCSNIFAIEVEPEWWFIHDDPEGDDVFFNSIVSNYGLYLSTNIRFVGIRAGVLIVLGLPFNSSGFTLGATFKL